MRKGRLNISISLILCFLIAAGANAQSPGFRWTFIDVDIEVLENGELLVTERQEYSFDEGAGAKRH